MSQAETELAALRRELAALRARVAELETSSGLYVSERELDGPKGDFRIPFDPRDWKGKACKGRNASQCPPEFLDLFASFCKWSAENPRVKPGREQYAAQDIQRERYRGALCRSWARRLRAGWKPRNTEDFAHDDALPPEPDYDIGAPIPEPPPFDDFEPPF